MTRLNWREVVLATLVLSAPVWAETFLVSDNHQNRTIQVQKSDSVAISGNKNQITIVGDCQSIAVSGNHNRVLVKGNYTQVGVFGNKNHVQLSKLQADKMVNSGKDNVIELIKASR